MENKNNFYEVSKARLSKIIESKMRTTFIGDISAFEQEFSDIPGFKERFNIVRKKILDQGNNNIRALFKELKQYDIAWTGEKIVMQFKPLGGLDVKE